MLRTVVARCKERVTFARDRVVSKDDLGTPRYGDDPFDPSGTILCAGERGGKAV